MPLGVVIVNRVLPELFTHADEAVFDALRDPGPRRGARASTRGRARPRCSTRPASRCRCAAAARSHLGALRERGRPAAAAPAVPVRPRPRAARSPAWWPRRSARSSGLSADADGSRRRSTVAARRRARSWCSAARAAWARRRSRPRPALTAAARLGGKVLVLTIDPAKRLADALGLEAFGNVERRVPLDALRRARRRAARRAVGRDARHQAVVGRARAAARARRGDRVPHPRQPAVPQRHQPLRAEPRLHRDGAALRPPRQRRVRPHHHRHAAHAERDRLPRGAGAHGRVLRRPAAALAHHAVPHRRRARRAHVQRGEPALLPDGRPRARQPVPPGHRRVLPQLPVDVRRLRRARGRPSSSCCTTGARRSRWSPRSRARRCREAEIFCARADGAAVPPRRARAQQDAARLPPVGRRRARGRRCSSASAERSRSELAAAGDVPRSPTRRRPRACCARSPTRSATTRWSRAARPSCSAELGRALARGRRAACRASTADIADVARARAHRRGASSRTAAPEYDPCP